MEGMNGGSSDNTQNSNQQNSISNTTNEIPNTNILNSNTIIPEEAVIDGDRGTENLGLCVFKDDVYVGDLSASEALCYSLIKDEVDNFLVRIDSPFNSSEKIDISVDCLSSSKVSIDISKENPIINIKLNLTAKALTGQDKLDYSNTEILNKLNSSLKEYLTTHIKNYLNKTSKEYKTDINEFYRTAKRKFSTISDYENYNWAKKYETAEFNIEIDSNILSSLLIQNS